MKPDFEKIAKELYEKARFFQEYYALQDIEHELSKARLEGRKAQMKVDAEIARNYQSRNYMFISDGKLTCGDSSHDDRWCSHCASKEDGADQVAKAIESQVIE